MRPEELYEKRKQDWETLTRLLKKSDSQISRMSPEEIKQLGQLYRAAASDLALARRDFPNDRVAIYLNQLVGKAHSVVYRTDPLTVGGLFRYFTHTLPQTFRSARWFVIASALLFFLPGLAGGITTLTEPAASYWLLPPGAQDLLPMIEDQELWTNIEVSDRPYASAFIMSNNIQVSFLAFSGGMLAGLVTAWVLLFNGLLLGSITGLTLHYGVGFELWTFVIGHGVIELSVIVIAGASGLMIGWAMLRPGFLRRRDAIAQAASRAIRLLIGCVPLLMIAGTIEGFISPNELIPPVVKWGIGAISGLALYGYLLLAGYDDEDEQVNSGGIPDSL